LSQIICSLSTNSDAGSTTMCSTFGFAAQNFSVSSA